MTTIREVIASARTKALAADRAQSEAQSAPTSEQTSTSTETGKGKYQVYKADADSGVIYLFGSAAEIIDAEKDEIKQSELIKAAHNFCASKGREFNANHGENHFDLSKAELVESVIGAPILKSGRTIALGEELPPFSEDPVIGMNIEKGKETHWLFGVRPNNDAVLEEAKKGGLSGASWEGFATRVEVK